MKNRYLKCLYDIFIKYGASMKLFVYGEIIIEGVFYII